MSQAAYVVGHITILDPLLWAEYKARVPDTLAPFGAELMLRGQHGQALAGSHPHTDIVCIRFADLEQARAWHDSPAYQALVPLRQRAARVDLMLHES